MIRLNLGDYFAAAARPVRKFNVGRIATAAVVGVLLVAVPTQLFSFVRPAPTPIPNLRLEVPNQRWFGLGELPDWYPHAGVAFLRESGMPPRVYARNLGLASSYLYEYGPQRKVFADPRLEVNTEQTLRAYLDLPALLITPEHYDRAEEILRGPDDGPLPALIFEPVSLLPYYEGLLANPRWRLVYFDFTCAVFLHDTDARRLELPDADHEAFDEYLAAIRAILNRREQR